ncbi:MAG: thiamine diphosphokinase [Lachnospiraceae bacterium]|nr:thiamine diphosphokinase [Lachnospiraceae bacterium]
MKHVLIITGGHLNIEFAKAYCKTLSYDKVFAVDKGLEYCQELDLIPDYIIGDFDTVRREVLQYYERKIQKQELSAILQRHPEKKDATDTELAVTLAVEQEAEYITLLGATGSRLDHVFANIFLLKMAISKGVVMEIADETNRIQILEGNSRSHCSICKSQQHGTYISLVPLTEQVEGVTIEGVEYPLTDATIYQMSSYTISNQITADKVDVSIKKGTILVVESRDALM